MNVYLTVGLLLCIALAGLTAHHFRLMDRSPPPPADDEARESRRVAIASINFDRREP